jgi:predicted transcriptional regulator
VSETDMSTWQKWAKTQKGIQTNFQAAKGLGITESCFVRLLNGRDPSYASMTRIARTRNIKISDLVLEVEGFEYKKVA